MSKVQAHWGVNKSPFLDRPIGKKTVDLFANRKNKLEDLIDIEDGGLVCLHGPQGIGKTSFYRWFMEKRAKELRGKVDYLTIEIVPQKKRILLQILRAVLEAVKSGQLHVSNRASLKVPEKLDRIEKIVTVTETIQGEASAPGVVSQIVAGLKVLFGKQKAQAFNPITDESAAEELRVVFSALNRKAFISVDNTEKLADFYTKTEDYVAAVSQMSHLLGSTFEPDRLTLGFSTDQSFVVHIRKSASSMAGVPSHSFSGFLEVDPLDIEGTRELIIKRLDDSGYSKGLDAFIENSALDELQNASDGSPRAVVLMLRNAMRIGAKTGDKQISGNIVWQAYEALVRSGQISSRKQREHTSETDHLLIEFIRENGERSPSDTDLQEASRLKTSHLRDRLKRLEELGFLESRRLGKRKVYNIRR